ncbi:MAG: hypothetical protein KGQ59_08940 [Bdellovibrionales bacterium]|nr:hypothetical protein [Bdellovibrionales bacterium]
MMTPKCPGEACHSPMAYLAKAIDSVLAKVDDQAKISAELEAALDAKIRKQKEDREAKEREDREIAEKIAEFERAHPDEHKRLEEIERLTHGSLLKSPNAKVVIAAQRWCHQ